MAAYVVCNNCGKNGHETSVCRTPKCEKCNKFGHISDECIAHIECSKCKKLGHNSDSCVAHIQCGKCNKFGHETTNCKVKICDICGRLGHTKNVCRSLPTSPDAIKHIDSYNHSIRRGIIILNTIFLDDKARWYAREINQAYFSSKHEWNNYLKKIHPNKPMDFKTIRHNVKKRKYENTEALIGDIIKVLQNAVRFNQPETDWYGEAKRLLNIVQCLKDNKELSSSSLFKPTQELIAKLKICPSCNNMLLTEKRNNQKMRCCECSKTIDRSSAPFICHNHSDIQHVHCKHCVISYCIKCSNWHNKKNCPNFRSHQNRSPQREHFAYGINFNLIIPPRPSSVLATNTHKNIQVSDQIFRCFAQIITKIEECDIRRDFFVDVSPYFPDYLQKVERVMHFELIRDKMKKKKYSTIGQITDDIELIWDNCFTFNGLPNPNDPKNFSSFAAKLKAIADSCIEVLQYELRKKGYLGYEMNENKKRKMKIDNDGINSAPPIKKRKLNFKLNKLKHKYSISPQQSIQHHLSEAAKYIERKKRMNNGSLNSINPYRIQQSGSSVCDNSPNINNAPTISHATRIARTNHTYKELLRSHQFTTNSANNKNNTSQSSVKTRFDTFNLNSNKANGNKRVQCNNCLKWRTIPNYVTDKELGDEWYCSMNKWDLNHASCLIPQVPLQQNEYVVHRADKKENNGVNAVIEVPDEYLCAITLEIMTDPVICCDGHTYQRNAIEDWLKDNNISPKTGIKLDDKKLIPNIALRNVIQEWSKKNKKDV